MATEQDFTPMQVKNINLVRIFLQVTTVSDITNAQGTHLTAAVWEANQLPDQYSTLQWPQQEQPTTQQWTVWCRLLKNSILKNKKKRSQLELQQPLGPWIGHTDHVHWKYNVYNNQLYVRQSEQNIAVYNKQANQYLARKAKQTPRPIQYQRFETKAITTARTVPKHSMPGTQTSRNEFLVCYGTRALSSANPLTTSWVQSRQQLPPAEYRLIHFSKPCQQEQTKSWKGYWLEQNDYI